MLKSSGKWLVALVLLALGVTGFGIFLALRSPTQQQTTTPSPNPAVNPVAPQTTAITALGRLEPESRVVKVAPPSSIGSARVARLMIKEGDTVKLNQVIAVMDDSDRLLASAIQAEAQVREAQSRLAQVRAGAKQGDIQAQQATVARLEAELKVANDDYRRYQQLHRDGAISNSELDNRRLRAETTARQLEQAKNQLNSVAEIRPTDVQQAEAQVQVAIATLQRAKADLDTAVVRSPIDGQVIKIHAYPGEPVSGSPMGNNASQGCNCIAELGKTNQMYVVAEIYETDIARVRQGQKATITSPAFEGALTGIVEQVGLQIRKNDVLNTDPAANTDARVVEVRIRLENSKPVAGMTNLQVNVAIAP